MSSTSSTSSILTVGRRKVPLTNLQKPLYPGGFTKGEVIEYYLRIAPVMLPHLKGRPVTLKRYPNGATAQYFYEKNCPSHRPPWVGTANVAKKGEEGPDHCLINGPAELVWAANLAALELHVPMAKAAAPDRPTTMVFDLDPGAPAGLRDCLQLGLRLRELVGGLGLESFPKTSGGKGLHVYIPLNTRSITFPGTKEFARAIAQLLERESPKKVTANMSRAGRAGKVFVDWSQNDRHKTTACPYSLRAMQEPRISTPVTWEEVEAAASSRKAAVLAFGPEDVLARVKKSGDLFEPLLKLKQDLPAM